MINLFNNINIIKITKLVTFSLILLIISTFFLKIQNSENCELIPIELIHIKNVKEYKLVNRDLDIFPEYKNIICLGRVINSYYEQDNNLIIEVGTNSNLKALYHFILTIFMSLIIIFHFKKNIFYGFLILFIGINYYFFQFNFFFSSFYKTYIPILITYFVINNNIEKINYTISKIFNFLIYKNNLFIILNIFFLKAYYQIFQTEFRIGYWLTNYNYGFVRRGFFGTIITNLPFSVDKKILFLTIFVCLIYLIFFFLVSSQIKLEKNQNIIFYIFSQFFIFSFLLDKEFFGPPEIIGMIFMLLIVRQNEIKLKNLILLVLFYTISILIHDVNLVFLVPTILYLNLKKNNNYKILTFLLITVSFIYILFYFYTMSGYLEIQEKICIEIEKYELREGICNGAISYLSDTSVNISFFEDKISLNWFKKDHNSYLSYSIPLFFVLILYTYFTKFNKTVLLILFVNILPLFLITKDWGRWINIFYFLNLLFLLKKINLIKDFQLSKIKILSLTLITNIFTNPHCCSVDTFVFPSNLFSNNFLIYIIAIIYLIFNSRNKIKLN